MERELKDRVVDFAKKISIRTQIAYTQARNKPNVSDKELRNLKQKVAINSEILKIVLHHYGLDTDPKKDMYTR